MKGLLSAASLLLVLAGCNESSASIENQRSHILVAGSSTVYPFTRAVAEQFKRKNGQYAAPVVNSTGTGAGFEAFCAGPGSQFPDLVDASRRMTRAELDRCRTNGVASVTELQIGLDGVVVAQSPAAPPIRLSRIELYQALAATPYGEPNTRKSWREVSPELPDIPILVYGPPGTSGTRESLQELILLGGCQADARMQALRKQDHAGFDRVCKTIRSDGAYVDSGEDDQRTSMQLVVNPGAIGIFGYSFLEEQGDRLRAVPVDGIVPDEASIASGRYPGARPLFVYVKGESADKVPGLRAFVAEYASAMAPGSYLAEHGLVPSPDEVRVRTAQAAERMRPVDAAALR